LLDGRTYDEVPDRVAVPVAPAKRRLAAIDSIDSAEASNAQIAFDWLATS